MQLTTSTGIRIDRLTVTDEYIEGKLYINDVYMADTLELPWRNNEQNVSCIPEGKYELHQRKVGRYYEAYKKRFHHKYSLWIRGIDGREYILIHTGNVIKDTRGCILVGVKAGEGRLTNSRDVYSRLWTRLDNRWGRLETCKQVIIEAVVSEAEFEPGERETMPAEEL